MNIIRRSFWTTLSKKRRRSTVFVTMDQLSGYIKYELVKALTTQASIRAVNKAINQFVNLGLKIKKYCHTETA